MIQDSSLKYMARRLRRQCANITSTATSSHWADVKGQDGHGLIGSFQNCLVSIAHGPTLSSLLVKMEGQLLGAPSPVNI